ncbi:thioredoxin family protein [Thiomicrorhabdus sp. 6S2-11]|uniref:Thioredoxin family protein n=1 Tax=Thiomicrorhabdus marina TaxID=2818442 RepID=A0ABS3Q6X9_9GAMM|nr:thioredoxin fold domain-containing protein [Thiomicrorhabdus marina]MBO1928095.1 thioredoxin family protein [Thiomicrorhabdus marina]
MLLTFITRMTLLSVLLLQTACDNSVLAGNKHSLAELQNLQTLGAEAKTKQLPILLIFSAEWCEYCEVLKEHVLHPMSINGMYEGKVVFLRNVGIDEPEPIPDWHGNPIKKSKWAYQINADLTPTVVFFDGNGKEVADRIIGISEVGLFASLVHVRINQAYANMGLTKRIPATPELLEQQQAR